MNARIESSLNPTNICLPSKMIGLRTIDGCSMANAMKLFNELISDYDRESINSLEVKVRSLVNKK